MNPDRKSTVLIVDDEASVRQVLADLLSPAGYELLFAENGSVALQVAAETMPDVILLDVMMPDLDGFEVCRILRAHPWLAEVPIIMLTALDDRDSRLRGIEAGADEFLSKPFDRTELRMRIRTITRLNRYRHLVAERSKFKKVVELAPDGIMIVDTAGTVCLANPALHQMLRCSDGTLKGRQVASLATDPHQNALPQAIQSLAHCESKVIYLETELCRASGERFPVEVAARSFPWEGRPGVQINVRDVAEKKDLEKQFLRAQRLQSIGSLAGGIAHDLNNVLTPLLVGTQILRSAVQDQRQQHLLDNMFNSAQRGASIIKQILTFARGVDGDRKPIELRYLIQETEKICTEIFPPTIQIRTDIPNSLPPVRADATQLHQVLMNLSVNARDAMPKGGLLKIEADAVDIEAAQAEAYPNVNPGPFVRLTISDSGCGIAPEALPKLFSAFFTTKEVGKGTGLGLATVQTIVKSHGGFVTVSSEVGRGTRFCVHLPAHNESEAEETDAASLEVPCGHGELVLVADDEPAIRELTKATLERFGYNVLIANDGAETVALYAQRQRDIAAVLTDSLMPFLSGNALVQALQKLNPKLPLVVMTSPNVMDQMKDADARFEGPFLLKPFTPEALLTRLHDALEQRRAA